MNEIRPVRNIGTHVPGGVPAPAFRSRSLLVHDWDVRPW